MALTDRFLAGLKPKARTVFFDTKSRGLALRASPAGSKTWLFVYRAPGKPPQWITLGNYPDLALVDARAAALEQRHAVNVQKRDPAAERREARSRADATPEPSPPPPSQPKVFTFADLAKLYETFARGRKKSWKDDVAMTNRDLMPAWGELPLRSITRPHVHELLDTW